MDGQIQLVWVFNSMSYKIHIWNWTGILGIFHCQCNESMNESIHSMFRSIIYNQTVLLDGLNCISRIYCENCISCFSAFLVLKPDCILFRSLAYGNCLLFKYNLNSTSCNEISFWEKSITDGCLSCFLWS